MTKFSRKSAYLLGSSALALMLSLEGAYALESTIEKIQMCRSGFKFDSASIVNLQRQAQTTASLLNADSSSDTVNSLPQAIAEITD